MFWWERVPEKALLISFFQRAEELGFHSLWVQDRLLHPISFPDPLILLSLAAGCTERIRLGTAVYLLSLRHPVAVARMAATLDMLSGGRLTLGVSLGGWPESGTIPSGIDEYQAMNSPKAQRVGRFEEGMAVLRRLWTETDVTFHGRYYHLEGANVSPKPPQRGGVSLPVGATAEPALRRAGRIGDGWIKGGRGSPASFAQSWRVVQEEAERVGRDPSKLTNLKTLYCNVDMDRERAQREVQRYVESYHGPGPAGEALTACGTPHDVMREVQAYGEAGCHTVALGLPWPDVVKLEMLAEEMAPLLV